MPRDVIAMVLCAGGLWLLLNGIDGLVGLVLIAITTFYFGAEVFKEKKRGVYG